MIAFNMKIFVNIAEIRVERINKIPTVVGFIVYLSLYC